MNSLCSLAVWGARFWLLLAIVMCFSGCGPERLCTRGVYKQFVPSWHMGSGYEPLPKDCLTIWMTTEEREGGADYLCLPRDLSIRNLSVPVGCPVSIFPPSWVKGRPLMAVYINHVSRVEPTEAVTFDIYQREVKKQTVRITFTTPPQVYVTINGDHIKARVPDEWKDASDSRTKGS